MKPILMILVLVSGVATAMAQTRAARGIVGMSGRWNRSGSASGATGTAPLTPAGLSRLAGLVKLEQSGKLTSAELAQLAGLSPSQLAQLLELTPSQLAKLTNLTPSELSQLTQLTLAGQLPQSVPGAFWVEHLADTADTASTARPVRRPGRHCREWQVPSVLPGATILPHPMQL